MAQAETRRNLVLSGLEPLIITPEKRICNIGNVPMLQVLENPSIN
jgi:hypothetical protein